MIRTFTRFLQGRLRRYFLCALPVLCAGLPACHHVDSVVNESGAPGMLPAFLTRYSDSSFTDPHDLFKPDDAPAFPGRFTHMGARYSGFETRRHMALTADPERDVFHYDDDAKHTAEFAFVRRSVPVRVEISSKWFTGNQVPAVSLFLRDERTGQEREALHRVPIRPDSVASFDLPPRAADGGRLELFHEGGLARVHFFGETAPDAVPPRHNVLEDAKILSVSNVHYGKPEQAVRGARKEDHMIGWESARTGAGEYALFALKERAVPDLLTVDTYMHRLNAPLTAHLYCGDFADDAEALAAMARRPAPEILFADGVSVRPNDLSAYLRERRFLREPTKDPARFEIRLAADPDGPWRPSVPFARLQPDAYLTFAPETPAPCTHVLFMFYPNGGIHGLKLSATPAPRGEGVATKPQTP